MAEVLEPGSRDESKPDKKEPSFSTDPATSWLEPQVPSLAIFTELFNAGDRTEAEMAQMLTRHNTNMGWAQFWAQEGYLTEVIRGSERRFTLTSKACLVLELP